jgi:membrane protease YdiL (CAAX protease family)
MAARHRPAIAFLVFVGWAFVTAFFAPLGGAAEPQPLSQSIAGSLQVNFVAAIIFLLAAVAIFRWWDVGLNPPRSLRSLVVLWFPGLYILLFVALLAYAGLPPFRVVVIILFNTVFAGISEELACRGVLYQGLHSRLPIWPAILISTLLFGAVHVLNGFVTGDFLTAGVQAIAAFLTGIAFMAIRVRTGSLYPGMILHGVWDFLLITSVTALVERFGITSAESSGAAIHGSVLALPVLFVVPNFLYGLFLLRHAARDERQAAASAAVPL